MKNYDNYEVSDIFDYQTFSINLSKEGADYFWEEINKDEQYNGKQPVSDISKVNEFIEQYNLPKDFYPCFQINKESESCLKKSKNYISIEEKFNIYVEEVEIAKPNYSYNERNKKAK